MKLATTERFEIPGGALAFVEASHAIPLVSVGVSLRSGSVCDPIGKEGLARLTARLMRRGCAGLTANEIDNRVDILGAELSGDTGLSSISMGGQVISRNIEPFAELLARIVSTPTFDEREFERLKRQTLAEIVEARDSDRSLAHKALRRNLFGGHLYGRGAGGTSKSLAAITLDDVRGFYAAHFTQPNVVIGFAGDVLSAEKIAVKLVEKLPKHAAPKVELTHPAQLSGRHLTFVDKPDRTQTQILIGTLASWPHDSDHVALTVANTVFGGTFTSRMMREVRSKRGWSYGASSSVAIERRRHSLSMGTAPGAADAAACLNLEIGLLESLVSGGISARELGFVKKYLTRSHAFEIDTAVKRVHQALDVELLNLPADYYSSHLGNVKNVTLEQANDALKNRIDPENLRIVVVGTADSMLDGIKAGVERLSSVTVEPYDLE